MDSLSAAALAAAAWFLQALAVQAGNTRLFGLLPPSVRWYTNSDMSDKYFSLVTPAGWAFAIWALIYAWELIGLVYLLIDHAAVAAHLPTPRLALALWTFANALQAIWSVEFATARLAPSAEALTAIATSLAALSVCMEAASTAVYTALVIPVQIHAGWTAAAALVNWNLWLVESKAPAANQLAAAHLTVGAATSLALLSLARGGVGAIPYALPLAWALSAVRYQILHPKADAAKNNMAIAEVGAPAREALAISAAAGALVIGVAVGLSALSRLVEDRRLVLV